MEKYGDELQAKLNQFWEWEMKEVDKRHDENYCFKEYVKKIRENK